MEGVNTPALERFGRHVIVALDVDTLDEASRLARELAGVVTRVKVGSRLFTAYGPAVLDAMAAHGLRVFLDLKYHDIPSVVGDACRVAAQHEALFLLTVHAQGGAKMIAQAVAGARAGALARGGSAPAVVAVTALTSMAEGEQHALGVADATLGAWAERLGDVAMAAGADGLVCSAQEVAALRARFGAGATLVTPGIRPAGSAGDDQTRVVTPAQGLALGSSYLVIGRPIVQAPAPRDAALAIVATL
jgi:orotidine-5'-phosphate decarboxylase